MGKNDQGVYYTYGVSRLLSVRSPDKTGCSHMAFVGNTGRASTTFAAPRGVWRLKAKVAHARGYFTDGGNHNSEFRLQATLTRADSSVVDLGTVVAKGCVFDEVVWPNGIEFSEPENVTLTLVPTQNSFGVVDDLRLGFAGVNLVQDGSFEDNTGWRSCVDKSRYARSSVERLDTCSLWGAANRGFCCHDGKFCAVLFETATYYQDIDFPEPGYYRLSFAVRSRAPVNGYGKNVLTFWQGGDDMGAITTNKIVQVQPDTMNFVEHSYLFYVPKKGVRRFGISGEGCPGVGIGSWTENSSVIDSVSIVRALDVDANAVPSAPSKMRISVDAGATLNLDFPGTLTCGPVTLGGTTVYGLVNAQTYPQYVTGVGSLKANNPGAMIIFR